MGLFNALRTLRDRVRRGRTTSNDPVRGKRSRTCRFEKMEPRQMLAGNVLPIHIGSVYYENQQSDDSVGDTIVITWNGGAPGTQLSQVVINTDKERNGLTIGDVFFDTQAGGAGVYGSIPAAIVDKTGIDSASISVTDGSTQLVIDATGWDAGEKLIFTIDVDEQGFIGANAVAEGNEFEGSTLAGTFKSAHHYDAIAGDMFLDYYDTKLAGTGLNLPPDSYVPPAETPQPVLTAGAIATVTQRPLPITISGTVFEDFNADNTQQAEDTGIPGVTLSLYALQSGTYVATGKTIATDANGRYQFNDVLPGTYRIAETQPAAYLSVGAKAGTVGGAVRGTVSGTDDILGVDLEGGDNSIRNDFAETRPASISGRVQVDLNGDCLHQDSEPVLPGVTIELRSLDGMLLATTLTDAQGNYAFTNLRPGTYLVHEVQPANYFDGGDHVGSAGGSLEAPDAVTGIILRSGTNGVRYDFCEIAPARLSGYVYVDNNENGVRDEGEPGIPNVTLKLGQRTAVTNEKGYYEFLDLPPGEYGVAETQPTAYCDGIDAAGSAGGTAINPGDSITAVTLGSGTNAVQYNFGEYIPAKLSGYVYADDDDDGLRDPGEAPIAGVLITLVDAAGVPTGKTAVTDANGYYEFSRVCPRTVGLVESQPDGYFDGKDTAGSLGGAATNPGDSIARIVLHSGSVGLNYNFGELRPASISGRVHAELNEDCIVDPGEPLLGGVTVYLLDQDGNRIAETTTNADGYYKFENLRPGAFAVQEVQPTEYLDGDSHVGSAGGQIGNSNLLTGIRLGAGVNATGYDFCELVPATLSGFVFQDGPVIKITQGEPMPDISTLRDGVLHPADKRLAGVKLQLGDGSGAPILGPDGQPIVTTTDANGYYEFTGLEPGVYTVLEVQPNGYVDGIDTPGSKGGVAINPSDNIDPKVLSELTVDPHDDAIVRIRVNAGEKAVNYNFSEVVVERESPPPFFPDPPRNPDIPLLPMPSFGPSWVAMGSSHVLPEGVSGSPFLIGGGGMVRNTWHLSVVNGGQPRRAQDGLESSVVLASRFNTASWSGVTMNQGTWTIADSKGKILRKVIFGMKGAVPVTGDWNGSGRSKMGLYVEGEWFLDLNGDGVWDEADLWAKLGNREDKPVTGDWDGDGKTDVGIFGPEWPGDSRAIAREPGQADPENAPSGRFKNIPPPAGEATDGYRTMKQTSRGKLRADLIDHVFKYGNSGDQPITGDWNGDGITTIGVFRDGLWYLDTNGDGKWNEADAKFTYGQAGDIPLVGDWNGDGIQKAGVFRKGQVFLDTNNNHQLDADDVTFQIGTEGDRVAVGDFDGDGADDVAGYHDGAEPGVAPQASLPSSGGEGASSVR